MIKIDSFLVGFVSCILFELAGLVVYSIMLHVRKKRRAATVQAYEQEWVAWNKRKPHK